MLLFMILIQVCILYFFSGFFKAQGEMWYHGTALYYILNLDSFSMNYFESFRSFILNSPFLLTLGAYLAIFTQLFFPFFVFNKYTRYLILFGSILFHFSIIIFMGLVQFGVIMIALDLQFISDREYKGVLKFIKGKVYKLENTNIQGEEKGA